MAGSPDSEIGITLAIDLSRVDGTMMDLQRKVDGSASRLDRSVSAQMQRTATRSGTAFERAFEGSFSKIGKMIVGGFLVQSFDRAIKEAARSIESGGNWRSAGEAAGMAFAEGFQSIPIVGAAYSFGQALSGSIFGDPEEEARKWSGSSGSTRGMKGEDARASSIKREMESVIEDLGSKSRSDAANRRRAYEKRVTDTLEAAQSSHLIPDSEMERFRSRSEDAFRSSERSLMWSQTLRKMEADARNRLSVIQQDIANTNAPNASDFIHEGQTAIGSYRYGQPDANDILREYAKKNEENTRKAAEILREIKQLEEDREYLG